jgi:hypothetical protein
MEKFLGIFPRIGRNFSENRSENFLGIFPKFVLRNIHSKTNFPKEKFRVIFAMKILLGTNEERTRNFYHGIIPTFIGFFPRICRNFS